MFDQPHDRGLPPEQIIARIEKALARDGTHTWGDVREMLLDGRAQIFWSEHGAWITEIVVSPRKRWLHIWVIAGQLPEVMELQHQAEAFCAEHKLERMMSTSRHGWVGLAKMGGYRQYGWHKYADMLCHVVGG